MWSRKGPATSASVMVRSRAAPVRRTERLDCFWIERAPSAAGPLASRNAASARVVRAPMPASTWPGENPARSREPPGAPARGERAAESSPLAGRGVVAPANPGERRLQAGAAEYQSWRAPRIAEGVAMHWQRFKKRSLLPEQPSPATVFRSTISPRWIISATCSGVNRPTSIDSSSSWWASASPGPGGPQPRDQVERHHFCAEPWRRVKRQQPLETSGNQSLLLALAARGLVRILALFRLPAGSSHRNRPAACRYCRTSTIRPSSSMGRARPSRRAGTISDRPRARAASARDRR